MTQIKACGFESALTGVHPAVGGYGAAETEIERLFSVIGIELSYQWKR